MAEDESEQVRTVASSEMTDTGMEVYAFHLHRFLADWLEEHGEDRMYVTVGFEGSECPAVTFDVRLGHCDVAEVGWNFEDLCHAYRSGDGRLRIEQRSETSEATIFEVLPILDRPATGGKPRVIIGFLVLPEIDIDLPETVAALQSKVGEAIRAARRNGVRMFFDDRESRPVKPTIYELMDHLPEWFGCDHSASMLMTSTLETMALEASQHGRLDVLAERLYAETDESNLDRLVGMSILLDEESASLLRHVVRRQLDDPDLPYQIYQRDSEEGWRPIGEHEPVGGDFHRLESRVDEEQYVFVPLKVVDDGERELLGFLCLAFRDGVELSSSSGEMLANLGRRLSSMLHYSPLYTLSARKLWILRRTRDLTEQAMTAAEAEAAINELIEGVSSLIAHQGSIPSFAIGYVVSSKNGSGRSLRYVHPHGWTHYDSLTLPVDVEPEERTDSGVSALAVRINRPLVLAGGRGEGESQKFKNYLYIHEETNRVVDARSPGAAEIEFGEEWKLLSEYYKPARWRAYATLAYPITFGGEVFGVLTIEVEKETDWVWWTGFGGQLFWQMLADELASTFWSMRSSLAE